MDHKNVKNIEKCVDNTSEEWYSIQAVAENHRLTTKSTFKEIKKLKKLLTR